MSTKEEIKMLPNTPGVYLAEGIWGNNEPEEIDVYRYRMKGLCCFSEDFGSDGTGVNDETDCHVSVQFTGLKFIKKIRDFKVERD